MHRKVQKHIIEKYNHKGMNVWDDTLYAQLHDVALWKCNAKFCVLIEYSAKVHHYEKWYTYNNVDYLNALNFE